MGGVRVVVGAYREWARLLTHRMSIPRYTIWSTPKTLTEAVESEAPDLVLLIGWSWMVPPEIYERQPTLCLHPSPLPRYRGGSPLQHQIINGEKESAVTIFRVTGEVDAGDIYGQCPISLDGSLEDIFRRIVQVGSPMLEAIVSALLRGEDPVHAFAQEVDRNPPLRRRLPEDSDLVAWLNEGPRTSEEIDNFIRALDHPDYPRAFIRGSDALKVELGWVR